MLLHYEIPVAGRRVVIVGRGPTLGRPLSMLLSLKEPGANAAVTVVHTGVPDWADSPGRPTSSSGRRRRRPSMITPRRHPARARSSSAAASPGKGRKARSDVDESCAEVAGWITPRLGGVGVTTVAMLLRNTVAARLSRRAAPRQSRCVSTRPSGAAERFTHRRVQLRRASRSSKGAAHASPGPMSYARISASRSGC